MISREMLSLYRLYNAKLNSKAATPPPIILIFRLADFSIRLSITFNFDTKEPIGLTDIIFDFSSILILWLLDIEPELIDSKSNEIDGFSFK